MFRTLTSTHSKKRLPYNSTPSFTSLSASPFAPEETNSLLLKLPNVHPSLKPPPSPPPTPLERLVHRYKSSQSLPRTLPSFPSFELYESLVSRYRDCCSLNDAEQFHLQILKTGFGGDLFLCNTLINVYVRAGVLASARRLFDQMSQRNLVSWASLISGYAQNGMPTEACLLFRKMVSAGFFPNHYAFGSVLRACQELSVGGLQFGMQIHGLILKSMYAFNVVVCNVLISMYWSLLRSTDYACSVFDEIRGKNLISWNSIISVYSQGGDVVFAFELFSNMQREGAESSFKPNAYTFGSLTTAACSSNDLGMCLLEQMLPMVMKSGFLSDLYVGTALLSGFGKFGLIEYAKKIFEQMSQRNAVSMNGLMGGLVRQKHGEEAAEVFAEMKKLVDVNLDSYVILLSAFAEFTSLEQGKRKGREVHGYVIRTGLHDTVVAIGNGLVNMYAKCGAIFDARSVFRLMVNKDSVSWNTMISGLDQNECFEDAVMSFHAMKRSGLLPSNFTLISTLSSCASLSWNMLGRQIHGDAVKLGLDQDVSVSNALLASYAATGCFAECQKIFSSMLDHDQVSWNSIIGALSDSEASVSEAINYFLDMIRAGWRPNRITFINILAAVSSLSLCGLGHQIHALVVKHHIVDDSAIENALLACYGKCGEMDACEKIFYRMYERRDDVSWNSMISGYIHNEMLPKAIDLVLLMMQKGQILDCFTFATVLSACASVATLERGLEVHASAIRACLESDVVVGSALVDMYSKCGRIDYASRFFEMMPIRNVYSWNTMISGYARHGHGEKALNLFKQMKLDGQSPDHVTFVGVLSACSHAGMVDEGFRHFKSMSELYGLAPRMEHYSCMVDLLGRAGEIDKIYDFINRMPMKPNVLIWRTVLGACCRANGRKIELGRKAAEILFGLEPENAVNYVLLANMYACGGRWEGVAEARGVMRRAAVKKEAGCSWVTMKDGVHVFVAGDKSHPDKNLIYDKLRELNRKMRDAGYVPQIRFAMYDVEPENKEELLGYHSEKLAVAFVLTRNSELPIRIMKNLRICGDCHSAFKYISKIVGRQVIVRDSNRFHHFNNGECSCGDYW